MFICEKCMYMFGIAKNMDQIQFGGSDDLLKIVFKKFTDQQEPQAQDFEHLSAYMVQSWPTYAKSAKKVKTEFNEWIKLASPHFFDDTATTANPALFVCKNCNHNKPIPAKTVLYTRAYGTGNEVDMDDYTHAVHDQTLARTRNYICVNSACSTHKKPETREAALTKNDNNQLVYICTVCAQHWVKYAL